MESKRELASSRVGQTLRGKWRLEALLGVGGMAAVYAATHRNGRRGAVKIPHPHIAADPVLRIRFLMEARATNAIEHPGVVAVLDDDEAEDGAPFLVMELLEGLNAEEALRASGPFPWQEALRVAEGMLSALAAAHERGIIHRDIKPDNVFLCRDGRIKILDFGIARAEDGASVTQTGATLGTPAYMAPEQAMGQRERVGPATDVWAVGATMFTLLTGRFVHQGTSINEVLVMAATRPAPPLGSLATLPVSVAEFIDKSLAFSPENRFKDAAVMLEALRAVRESPGPLSQSTRGPDANGIALEGAPTRSVPVLLPPGAVNSSLVTAPTEVAVSNPASVSSAPQKTSEQSPSQPRGAWALLGLLAVVLVGGGARWWMHTAPSVSPPSPNSSGESPSEPREVASSNATTAPRPEPSALAPPSASSAPVAIVAAPSASVPQRPAIAQPRPPVTDSIYDRRR